MSIHCKLGDTQAIITYKIGNNTTKTVVIKNVPIDVKILQKDVGFQGGQCPIWYSFIVTDGFGNYVRYKNRGVGCLGPIKSLQLILKGEGTGPFDKAYVIVVEAEAPDDMTVIRPKTFQTFVNYAVYGVPVFHGIETYNPLNGNDIPEDNCGDPQPYCEILVSNSSGTIIFSDRGKCPVTYSVSCGDCPEGTFKCNAPGYPGYCCLPCKEIAGEIKAIASQVRRINNV